MFANIRGFKGFIEIKNNRLSCSCCYFNTNVRLCYKKAFFNLCDYGFFNIDNSYDDISFSYEFYLKYNHNMKLNIVLNKDEQYILSLISGILSLYLDTDNKCQIYNPALVYTDGQTSFSIDNIPMPLLECLYEEAENRITNYHILSRFFDIMWVVKCFICVKIEDYIKTETNLNWIENCINLLCRLYIKMEKYDEHRTILEKLSDIYEKYANNVDKVPMKIS